MKIIQCFSTDNIKLGGAKTGLSQKGVFWKATPVLLKRAVAGDSRRACGGKAWFAQAQLVVPKVCYTF